MDLSEKLKAARAAKRMSQEDLAKAIGVSTRTIQNYELGASMPKSRAVYEKLSQALGVDEAVLLDSNSGFVLRAAETYGRRGMQQAMDMVADIHAMWAGGEMAEEDMDEIMQAMQEAYWEAKELNRRNRNDRS